MRHATLMLAVLCLFASTAPADELFVPSAEYPTIQAAVDAAVDGDEVVLRDGVFTGAGNWGVEVPDTHLVIRSESGDPQRTVLTLFDHSTEERHGGFRVSGIRTDTVEFRGLTVREGYYALSIDSRTVRVRDCVFEENRDFDDFGMGTSVGGAVVTTLADCEFHGCRFTDNSVGSDGRGGSGSGGAMAIFDSTVAFFDCVFENNTAYGEREFGSASGGAITASRSTLEFTSCVFNSNLVSANFTIGGALSASDCDVTMISCEFQGNRSSASGSANAGAFRIRGSLAMIGGSVVSNAATDEMTFEGCCGGFLVSGDALFVNVLIRGNRVSAASCTIPVPGGAGGYGGAGSVSGIGEFANCTISGNSANCTDGLYIGEDSDVRILNSILRQRIGEAIYADSSAIVDVRYSNIEGGFPGEGNIDADPLFAAGTYHLLPDSPCIDAGNTDLLPADEFDLDGDGDTTEPLPLDAAGLARFVDDPATPDTGVGFPVVDMGAFEFQPACRVDLDGDGVLTIFDFLAFFNAFDDADPVADFDGDGAFTVLDFLAFQDEFDAGCP